MYTLLFQQIYLFERNKKFRVFPIYKLDSQSLVNIVE